MRGRKKELWIKEGQLIDALVINEFNFSKAAKELGITRAGVSWLAKKFDLKIVKVLKKK